MSVREWLLNIGRNGENATAGQQSLAWSNAARAPGRSVLTIALLAFAPHIDIARLWTFHNYSGVADGAVWPASTNLLVVFLLGLWAPIGRSRKPKEVIRPNPHPLPAPVAKHCRPNKASPALGSRDGAPGTKN